MAMLSILLDIVMNCGVLLLRFLLTCAACFSVFGISSSVIFLSVVAFAYINFSSNLRFKCRRTANSIIAPTTKNKQIKRYIPNAVSCPAEGLAA